MLRGVDPDGGRFCWWLWRLFDEALGIGVEGTIEGVLSGSMDGVSLAVMDLVRGHQPETNMVMVLIVPGEELAAELACILNAAEAFWESWLVFEGLEVAFGEGVVVGVVGAAVRLGDAAEVGRGGRARADRFSETVVIDRGK